MSAVLSSPFGRTTVDAAAPALAGSQSVVQTQTASIQTRSLRQCGNTRYARSRSEEIAAKRNRARSLASLALTAAGFFQGADVDAGKAAAAGERRVQSPAKLRDALTRALAAIHALLRPDQRERFAYLVRTGVLAF